MECKYLGVDIDEKYTILIIVLNVLMCNGKRLKLTRLFFYSLAIRNKENVS